jgi:uncharacterized tellurite resistance protein B-like protein
MADFAFTQDDMKGLREDQQSAIFDALVTAAWADGNVSKEEMERFEQEVVKIPWGKPQDDLVKMVYASKERVSSLKDVESVMGFIKAIAEKLPDVGLREKLLYLMGSIMFTDRELNNAERNIIGAFIDAFGVTKERFDAIGGAIRGS